MDLAVRLKRPHWDVEDVVVRFRLDLAGCSDPQCISVVPESVRIPVVTYFFDEKASFLRGTPHDCLFSGGLGGAIACASFLPQDPEKVRWLAQQLAPAKGLR